MPCPQCGHLIEFSVEELLRRCFFRCMHCGLELRLNG
jgi:transcription elongation factor Elf1